MNGEWIGGFRLISKGKATEFGSGCLLPSRIGTVSIRVNVPPADKDLIALLLEMAEEVEPAELWHDGVCAKVIVMGCCWGAGAPATRTGYALISHWRVRSSGGLGQ